MENDFISKNCERCDAEVKVPEDYFEDENIFKLCQVDCPNGCKIHTFDSNRMKWLR